MCIHALYIYHCGHHCFSSEPLIPCSHREQDFTSTPSQAPLESITPYPTARALNKRLAERTLPYQSNERGPLDPSALTNTLPTTMRCRPRGHPYRSHFVSYLCAGCESIHQELENERQARLAANLSDGELVEHVRLQEWQWRVRLGVKMKGQHKRGQSSGETSSTLAKSSRTTGSSDTTFVGSEEEGDEGDLPLQPVEELKLRKRIEEREMLRKMEEANRELETVSKRSTREMVGTGKRKSWMEGWKASWGGGGGTVAKRGSAAVTGRRSWGLLGPRLEY